MNAKATKNCKQVIRSRKTPKKVQSFRDYGLCALQHASMANYLNEMRIRRVPITLKQFFRLIINYCCRWKFMRRALFIGFLPACQYARKRVVYLKLVV